MKITILFGLMTVWLGMLTVSSYGQVIKNDAVQGNFARQHVEHVTTIDHLHTELVQLDTKLSDSEHNLQVLRGQVGIIDESINGRDKRRARITTVVSAIKETLPGYGNPIVGCPKNPSPGEIWSIAGAIVDNADEYAVPAALIAGIIRQESAFCNQAVSPAGAKGYMQLMPDTAAQVSADVAIKNGRALRTWRGRDNIQLGTAYISQMLMEFDGEVKHAVAAYNAGPNHVKKVLAGMRSEYYSETRDYIVKVIDFRKEYDSLGVN